MKSAIKITFLVVMVTCFLFGNAQAVTINYTDDFANWPGYPVSPPYTVNPLDQIGTFPTIAGANITISSGFLASIVIDITNLRNTENLFINTSWNPAAEIYDKWDLLVKNGTLYAVSGFTPANYILVNVPPVAGQEAWRTGHPYSIGSGLTPASGLSSMSFDGSHLTYNFTPGVIAMGDRFVFGLSEDCGNDVFLTPVPEPISLLFLGVGLLGVFGISRKMRKVS